MQLTAAETIAGFPNSLRISNQERNSGVPVMRISAAILLMALIFLPEHEGIGQIVDRPNTGAAQSTQIDRAEQARTATERKADIDAINTDWQAELDALGEESIRRWNEIQSDYAAGLADAGKQEMSPAKRQAVSTRLSAEKDKRLAEYKSWRAAAQAEINAKREARYTGQVSARSQGPATNTGAAASSGNGGNKLPSGTKLAEVANAPKVSGSQLDSGAGAGVLVDATESRGTGSDAGTGPGGIASAGDSNTKLDTGGKPPSGDAGALSATDAPASATGASDGVDAPEWNESEGTYRWGDGTVARGVSPDGDVGKVNDKGDIVFTDGTTIVHTGNKEVVVHRPDGSATTRQANENGVWATTGSTRGPATGGDNSFAEQPKYDSDNGSYGWSDGSNVTAFDSNGEMGKINDKGDVMFNDGTTIVHTGDGQVAVHRPDGSTETMETNEDGVWQSTGSYSYVSEKNSKGSGESSQSGGGSGSGGETQSDDNDQGSDDSSKDSKDSGSDSGGDDTEGGDGDSSSDSDSDTDTDSDDGDTGTKENYGDGSGGTGQGPSTVVQAIVDRATGNNTTPESAVPEECGPGSTVGQPGLGSGSCIPAGLPGISTEEEDESPDAGSSAVDEDARRAGTGGSLGDRITQPGLGEQGIPVDDLPSQSQLDRAPVTNPAPNNN